MREVEFEALRWNTVKLKSSSSIYNTLTDLELLELLMIHS